MEDRSKAVEVFEKYAELYQSKFMAVEAYSKKLDEFIAQLSGDAAILDIACGPGNISRYLLDQNSNFNILGIDLAASMIELASKNCPEAHFQIMDARDIRNLSQRFNGIVTAFCLPYLNKKETSDLFLAIFQLLLPGGCLYISAILGEYEQSGYKTASTGDKVFTYYYSEANLADLLQQAGLQLFSKTVLPPLVDSTTDTEVVILAKKASQESLDGTDLAAAD